MFQNAVPTPEAANLFTFPSYYFMQGAPFRGPGQRSRYSDSLRDGWSGDRIPVGATFSAPVQNVPGTHPASYTMSTGSFPGVKRPGRGVGHPLPSRAEVEGRVGLYICSLSGPSWPVLGRTLPFLSLPLRCSFHPSFFVILHHTYLLTYSMEQGPS